MKGWIRRRWYDFRVGHSTYLGFLLSLTNFLLIVYNFLISQVTYLRALFPDLWVFCLVSAFVYCPLAMYIGYWHRKHQLNTDLTMQAEKNPIYFEIMERLDKIEEILKK